VKIRPSFIKRPPLSETAVKGATRRFATAKEIQERTWWTANGDAFNVRGTWRI
jgi:hypothetical protein